MNLPVLGSLFRSRDYQRQETELMIAVTPYIARPLDPKEVTRPDQGYADATDPQGVFLGRVNRLYSTTSNPQALQNYKGKVGFIDD
jgi:pilus assembly protein CpaC